MIEQFKFNKHFLKLLLVIFFVVSLPLKNNINSISIILLSVFALFTQIKDRSFDVSVFKKLAPFILYFLLAGISILYSEDTSRALKSVTRLLPLLLLPLIFSTLKTSEKNYFKILHLYAGWIVVLCLYSHTLVLIKLFENNDILFNIFNSHYSYLSLSEDTVGIHSTYYAYFILTAVIIILFSLLNVTKRMTKLGLVCVLIYLSFFIFHLSSRLPIVVLFLIYNAAIIYYFFKKKKLKTGVFYLICLYVITFFIGYNVRITRYRFQQIFGFTYANGIEYNDGIDKLKQWQAGIEANDNFVFGAGIGDANNEIYSSYRALDLDPYADKKYNAHNQYVQSFVGLGFLGALVLLFIFGYVTYLFFKEKDFIGLLFVLSSAILFITKSMLERHHGIVLFVFFVCFGVGSLKKSSLN